MELRQAYLKMIKAFPGGWDAIAGALGMSRDALENRVYERKGQACSVDVSLQMQKFTGTTHFAEALAVMSGGVFMKLPDVEADEDELLSQFNELYAELGELSGMFKQAIKDGEIDKRERAELVAEAQKIHRTLEHLLAVSFKVYCHPHTETK